MRLWTTLLVSFVIFTEILSDKLIDSKIEDEPCPCLPVKLCPKSFQHDRNKNDNFTCKQNEVRCCQEEVFKTTLKTVQKTSDIDVYEEVHEAERETKDHFVTVQIQNLTHSTTFNESFSSKNKENSSSMVENTSLKIVYSKPYNASGRSLSGKEDKVVFVFPIPQSEDDEEVETKSDEKVVKRAEDGDLIPAGSENVEEITQATERRVRLPPRRLIQLKNSTSTTPKPINTSINYQRWKNSSTKRNSTVSVPKNETEITTKSPNKGSNLRKMYTSRPNIRGSTRGQRKDVQVPEKMNLTQIESMVMEHIMEERERIEKRMVHQDDYIREGNEEIKEEIKVEESTKRNYRRNRPRTERTTEEPTTKPTTRKYQRGRRIKNRDDTSRTDKEVTITTEVPVVEAYVPNCESNSQCQDLLKSASELREITAPINHFVPPENMETGFVPIVGPGLQFTDKTIDPVFAEDMVVSSELQLPGVDNPVTGFSDSNNSRNGLNINNSGIPLDAKHLFLPGLIDYRKGRMNYQENLKQYYDALQQYDKQVQQFLVAKRLQENPN